MPDISKINNVAVADISKLDSITFAHGQKVNNQDVSLVTDAHTLIGTPLNISVSDTAVGEFDITSGIDDTYDVYEFHCIGIHPSGASLPNFEFQVGTAAESGWNRNITSTYFQAQSNYTADGAGNYAALGYSSGEHQRNSDQAFQKIAHGMGDENNDSASVILKLYAPSSAYVKHFTSVSQMNHHNNSIYSGNTYCSGYINTTAAITRIRFQFGVGNIDAGKISMYGVAKS